MNIFATSLDPEECARNLDSKRLVKMVLETTQILSTVCFKVGQPNPYKPTHINHPCVIWARETEANYTWLYYHYIALCEEYTRRYKRTHKCEGLRSYFIGTGTKLPGGRLTPFANCTVSQDDKHQGWNVIFAYHDHLNKKWQQDAANGRPPKWGLQRPDFVKLHDRP